MNRSLALSSVWFAAPTCTFQVVACRAHLHHPGRLSSSFACSACQSSVTDSWSLGGFWKGLVFGLWLPSTNELCHAVCLHISVFCLGSVSALLCMMTSLGNSLPASGPLALLTPSPCVFAYRRSSAAVCRRRQRAVKELWLFSARCRDCCWMTTPGVEPGLSRPRRDVLTTRRCGH